MLKKAINYSGNAFIKYLWQVIMTWLIRKTARGDGGRQIMGP
jgi:hypothetical protein